DIPGDILLSDNPIALDGEGMDLDTFPDSVGDVLVQDNSDSFPLWPIIGIGGLALILLLLLNGDSSSAQASVSSGNIPILTPIHTPLSLTSKGECDLTPSGNGSDHTQMIEIPCNITPKTPTEVKRVVEPSMIKALVLLIVLLCIVRYKHRSLKIRNS
ncbi:MAG: hypothetical protein ACYTXY_39695, partial [Nostoc sp.]